jgi:hypothetical protein
LSEQGEIHRHSGWVIPLAVACVIAALCGAFLVYYLRPAPEASRDNSPVAAGTIVALSVHGLRLRIPARFISSRAARNGGDREEISVLAALPDMRGYSAAEAALFSSNEPDSPLVRLLIHRDRNALDAKSRLDRLYMPYIPDPRGETGPFQLKRYGFRPDSGYGRDELFVGGGGMWLCERPAQDVPSPNCLSIDRGIAPGVSLSYRFKRAQLAHWRAIEAGVDRLMADFRK